ncbi:phytanoyl-CoA dioxygenase family protein [Streptomyces sp. NPDC005402]|uniref:phytanoyl-CoA dioxygenase family protein n=1 Tax=Streptomyces sp. NPDC005402 TaxID=3155338 RepID=UPI0033B7A44E
MTHLTLTDKQRADYRDQGFLGPLPLMSVEEMTGLRPELEAVLGTVGLASAPSAEQTRGRLASLVEAKEGKNPVPAIESRHLDSPLVHRLCTHPSLLAVARALYGDDLLLWRSTFIAKASGGPEFRWHQDWGGVFSPGEEYGLEPPLHFTFWIAISDVTPEAGCLQFVPGVRAVLSAVPSDKSAARATMLVPDDFVEGRPIVPMPLRPGECVVFTDRALHSSGINQSGRTRLGLAVRLTLPSVQVRPHFPGHACQIVSGEDRVGLNQITQPPRDERSVTSR